ncbi:MAG: cell wall-binding protein [Clostridium butyricum]|nr:cell wall-binding protein [Clostridium butyricum]
MKGNKKLKKVLSFLIAFAMIFSFMQFGSFSVVKATERTQVPGLIFRVGGANGDIKVVDKAADNSEEYVLRQLTMAKQFTLQPDTGYTLEDASSDSKDMRIVNSTVGGKKVFSIVNIKNYSNFLLTVKIKKDGETEAKTYKINTQFMQDPSLEFGKIEINYSGKDSYQREILYSQSESEGVYKDNVDSDIDKATIQMYDSQNNPMDFKVNNGSNKSVNLIGGENEIKLTVTSNSISKVYTLIVNKKGQAKLKSLVPSAGTLKPAFNPEVYDYEITVPTSQEKIAFTPITVDNASTVRVKRSKVSSGKKSPDIALEEGQNKISIVVTTQDGDSTTYNVVVTRTEQFRSSNLNSLTLTSGNLSPTFNKGIYEYTTIVENSVTSVGVKANTEDPNATVKINGKKVPSGATSPYISLDEGGNIITVVVTDTKGKTSTYTINITRRYPKNNVNLSSLVVTDGKLSPIFDPETYLYSVKVARNVDFVRVKFSAQNDKSTIKINGVQYTNGQSDKIKLKLGANTVKVEVVAEDRKSTTTYSLSIIRDKVEGKYDWVIDGDQWTYYNGYGTKVKNEWVIYDNLWYFMDINGHMQTGWQKIGGVWYFFNSKGIMQTGWMYDKGYWYYLQGNGALRTNGWAMYDGNWYLFNELGEMQTGWHLYCGKWYYMSDKGVMQKGWITYDRNKYYLDDDGSMRTGWLFNGKVWYYFGNEGKMRIGWQTINGRNYYFDASGAMKTGMMFLDGRWINLGNI